MDDEMITQFIIPTFSIDTAIKMKDRTKQTCVRHCGDLWVWCHSDDDCP